MSKFASGIISALVGASLWGVTGACAQFLFAHYDVTSLFIMVVRLPPVGLAFGLWFALTRADDVKGLLRDSVARRRLVIFGVAGLFMSQFTYVVSVSFTNAGTATVLQSLSIVFVMLVTCMLRRRLPKPAEVFALVCAFTACVLIATKGDLGVLSMPVAGLAWGVVNGLSVAFYIMYPRPLLERWGSLMVTGLGMFAGGLFSLLLFGGAYVLGASAIPEVATQALLPALDAVGWFVLVLFVIIGAAAFVLYLHGVAAIGGVKGSLLGTMEPVSATVLSALWLATPFVWADWVGLVLMVATVIIVTLARSDRDALHA